jgi:hypothetical protein
MTATLVALTCQGCGTVLSKPNGTFNGKPISDWWAQDCNSMCMTCRYDPSIATKAVARRTDPQTSWDAARSVGDLRASQAEVYALFTQPLTDEEMIATAALAGVKQSESGLRTRRSELVTLGLLQDTGLRGVTANNRQSIKWGLT